MKISRQNRLTLFFVIFCLLAVAFWSGYSWYIKKQNDDERAMVRLSKMIELPQEIPTIATVTDKEKLANQPFFQKAENGDKIIIYTEARRAYLYRPASNKIIDMTVVTKEDPGKAVNQGNENMPVFQVNDQ